MPKPYSFADRDCSFCGKSGRLVRLVAGPGVYICSECVALCVEILEDEQEPQKPESR